MKLSNISCILFLALLFFSSCSCLLNKPICIKKYTRIETSQGQFFIGLYEGTPLHRDNFIENSKNSVYDSVNVYQITTAGKISAGINAAYREDDFLSDNFHQNTIDSEFNNQLFHKKYSVGMMRQKDDENPERKSDSRLFYIVTGMKLDDRLLGSLIAKENSEIIKEYSEVFLAMPENKHLKDSLEMLAKDGRAEEWRELRYFIHESAGNLIKEKNIKVFDIDKSKRSVYESIGGVPVYDNKYSVFGEVTFGHDVVDKISEIRTDIHRRPLQKVYILSTEILNKREYKRLVRNLNKQK